MNASNRSFTGYLDSIYCGKLQIVECVLAGTQYLGLLILFGTAVLLVTIQPSRLAGEQSKTANAGEAQNETNQLYFYTAPQAKGQGNGQAAKESGGLEKSANGVVVISSGGKSDNVDQDDIIILPNYNLRLLREKSVLKELKITAPQKKKLQEIQTNYQTDMQKFFEEKRNMSRDEMMKEYRQWDLKQKNDIQKQVEKILTPQQTRSLKELTLREDARGFLFAHGMFEKVGVTAEQKEKLLLLQKEEMDRIQQFYQETTDKMLAVLDPAERAQLADEALGPTGPEVIDTQEIDAGGEIGKIYVPSLFPYPDFSEEQVQKQLDLTTIQQDQVRDILGGKSTLSEKLVEEWQKLPPEEQKTMQNNTFYTISSGWSTSGGGNLSPEEQKKRQAEFEAKIRNDRQKRRAQSAQQPLRSMNLDLRAQFEEILTVEQLAAYKDLAFRNIANMALTDPPTLNKAGVSDQQKAEVKQLHDEHLDNVRQFGREMGEKC